VHLWTPLSYFGGYILKKALDIIRKFKDAYSNAVWYEEIPKAEDQSRCHYDAYVWAGPSDAEAGYTEKTAKKGFQGLLISQYSDLDNRITQHLNIERLLNVVVARPVRVCLASARTVWESLL
jgi:hypothetical protein